MRVSNAERAEVTDALCRHFADGRLDEEEFNDRVTRANGAKTRADLAPLLADLPRLDAHAPVVPRPRRRWHPVWILLGVLMALSVVTSVAGGTVALLHPHVPWFLIAVLALVFLRRRRWHARYHDRL